MKKKEKERIARRTNKLKLKTMKNLKKIYPLEMAGRKEEKITRKQTRKILK